MTRFQGRYQPEPSYRGYGGSAVHLLPEEIEAMLEFWKNHRPAAFVAPLMECSRRAVAKRYARFHAAGLLQYTKQEMRAQDRG